MSCASCNQSPCGCSFPPDYGAEPPKCSRCTGDRIGNVWVERGPTKADLKAIGVCMLDTLTDDQIIYILERDEKARADLFRITTDPHLLDLARNVPRLATIREEDTMQNGLTGPQAPAYYALFRGQPPQ